MAMYAEWHSISWCKSFSIFLDNSPYYLVGRMKQRESILFDVLKVHPSMKKKSVYLNPM